MANNARIVSICVLVAVTSPIVSAMRKQTGNAAANGGLVSESAGTCAESAVSQVCKCEHKSWGKGYQCSKCVDKFRWGYGCDLECPQTKCPFGCDFSGNCNVPAECKRNSRVDNPTDSVINDRGECQACESGYHGLWCSKRCPSGCDKSYEGQCTRGGTCYKCKPGFFGTQCDQSCPASCPDCVITDNVVKGPDGHSFLPAGSCPKQCKTDHFGSTCSEACPANCKKTQGSRQLPRIPSCLKETGFCVKCTGKKWFGDTCENECSKGCGGGTCLKDTGLCDSTCEPGWWGPKCDSECASGCNEGGCDMANGKCKTGCISGWWGERCDQECPDGTDPGGGCKHENGEPASCVSGRFPALTAKGSSWSCASCPENCANNKCDSDGQCTEGCEEGFYGSRCNLNCPPHCDGPCDAMATKGNDGWCPACETGWTGKKCTKHCSPTCEACNQRGDATAEGYCTACRKDEPSELADGYCKCIEGASRNPDDQKCYCNEPEDPASDMMSRFETRPQKVCRFICKEGFREVFGTKESICLTNAVYKSVVRAEIQGFNQGNCEEGEYDIPLKGDATKCIRKDYVENIVQ